LLVLAACLSGAACASIAGLEDVPGLPLDGGADIGTGSVDDSSSDTGQSNGGNDASADVGSESGGGGDSGAHDADASGAVDAKSDGPSGQGTISYVQYAWWDTNNSATNVAVTYAHPQHSGDLNVVVVGWSSAQTDVVSAVTDSAGNKYVLAATPQAINGSPSDGTAVYYAANIAASASNTVTVTFNGDTGGPGAIVLEYSGVHGMDQTAGATGMSPSVSSGSVSTTATSELVVGAGESSYCFKSAGLGFVQRAQTTNVCLFVEDMIVSQTGTYAGTASQQGQGPWVMEVATFK
jgi:hypothetical protein